MLLLSNGTVIVNETFEGNSYNFTGLTPDTNYSVTVAGRNNAGVGVSNSTVIKTPSEW